MNTAPLPTRSLSPPPGPPDPPARSYVGLKNLGNSCYMNSVLQLLWTLPPLRARYAAAAEQLFRTAPADAAADFPAQVRMHGVVGGWHGSLGLAGSCAWGSMPGLVWGSAKLSIPAAAPAIPTPRLGHTEPAPLLLPLLLLPSLPRWGWRWWRDALGSPAAR